MKWKIRLRSRHIDGVACPSPELTLWVRDRYGSYAPILFVLDTGSDLSGLPISLAEEEQIPFPRTETARGRARGLVGAVEKFRGVIHLKLGAEEFDWPCNFLSATPGSDEVGRRGGKRYGVLGRAGFQTAFKYCIGEPYLTLQRRLKDRPWWYRLALALLPLPAVAHSPDVPL